MKVSIIRRSLAAAAAALCAVGPAYAVTSSLSFESLAGLYGTDSAYTGTFQIAGSTLTVQLQTSGASGYLTGVAFNAPDGAITGMTSAPVHFKSLDGAGALPFGVYSDGAGLGGSWHNGGNAGDGVPVGERATFVYALANDSYKASDFWSDTCSKTQGCMPLVVRFRGLEPDSGDKVSASLTTVPEPETYALMLAGVGLVGFIARRRRPD
jgi:PEP-CTERM motif